MGDYTPHYEDGPWSSTASAAITGGQLLMVTGDNTVGPTTGAVANAIGVAAMDVASGDRVTIRPLNDLHTLTAAGAIAAGDQVVPAAAGKVASLAAAAGAAAGDINNARNVVGVATTTAIDGAPVDVKGR